MNFIHYEFKLHLGDAIRVVLDHQANVRLMDDANYALYKSKQPYKFIGGHALKSPVVLEAPAAGHWNIVIDADGHESELHATLEVIKKH